MNLSSRYLHFEHRPVHFNVDDRHFNDAFEFPLADWNDVVETQVSMSKWLKNNGLRKHCLCMEQIVSLMRDGFFSSNYSSSQEIPMNLKQLCSCDEIVFNNSCYNILQEMKQHLTQLLSLFRQRLTWLTSESRRSFGVVVESVLIVVLDISAAPNEQLDNCRRVVQQVLQQQFHHVSQFNIVRSSNDLQIFRSECVPCSDSELEKAIEWLWQLDCSTPTSGIAIVDSIQTAMADDIIEVIYLFSDGLSRDCYRDLEEMINQQKPSVPVHCVLFNCDNLDTISSLNQVSKLTGGRFHAYCSVKEAEEAVFERSCSTIVNDLMKSKVFGSIDHDSSIKQDIIRLLHEIQDGHQSLWYIETLIEQSKSVSRANIGSTKNGQLSLSENKEQYMSSKQWLLRYGIDARKLNLYDCLSGMFFRHKDGVVVIMEKPPVGQQTDATSHRKVINARYCERFPVIRWKDGSLVHIHVTPEIHRSYEKGMKEVLNTLQQRVDWLMKGSRVLFGTILEDHVCILIDTSSSMQLSIEFVKQKLFVLIQEQLRHKSRFNLIAFNSKVDSWREQVEDVSEQSLQSACMWVQDLTCCGTTNTLFALLTALADVNAQGIYLLTDGRPDQAPKSIIAQAQLKKQVPVHTISFNCTDTQANQFLYSLARSTNGRYHWFSESGVPSDGVEAWQCEDLKDLKDEVSRGMKYLEQLSEIRDMCCSLFWQKDMEDLERLETEKLLSTSIGPVQSMGDNSQCCAPMYSSSTRSQSLISQRLSSEKQRIPKRSPSSKTPLVCGHTRTSLLRMLRSSDSHLYSDSGSIHRQVFRGMPTPRNNLKDEKNGSKMKHKISETHATSAKFWLKKHGLVAKRLTLLDALSPTLVPHCSQFVPILNKNVPSRVFDEVFPFAYVSGGDGQRLVHLINPNGVNLKEYEGKLRNALSKYQQHLSSVVWDSLSLHARQQFQEPWPVPFSDDRAKFLQVLCNEGWPVSETDIVAMELEIEKGEKFLQQSRSLRKAASNLLAEAPELLSCDTNDISCSTHISGSKTTVKVRNNVACTKVAVSSYPSPSSDDISTGTRSQDENCELGSKSPASSEVSIHSQSNRKYGTDLRFMDCGANLSGKKRNVAYFRKQKKAVVGPLDSTRTFSQQRHIAVKKLSNTRVIARSDADGFYYPGLVVNCSNIRKATVNFLGKQKEILTKFLIPISGAVPCPSLLIGDSVLVRVRHMQGAEVCFVPAIVVVIPRSRHLQVQFHTVLLFNGQKVTTRRRHLLKISEERFEVSVRYINAMLYGKCNRSNKAANDVDDHGNYDVEQDDVTNFELTSRPRSPTPAMSQEYLSVLPQFSPEPQYVECPKRSIECDKNNADNEARESRLTLNSQSSCIDQSVVDELTDTLQAKLSDQSEAARSCSRSGTKSKCRTGKRLSSLLSESSKTTLQSASVSESMPRSTPTNSDDEFYGHNGKRYDNGFHEQAEEFQNELGQTPLLGLVSQQRLLHA